VAVPREAGRFRRALNALARFDGQDGVVRAARALRAPQLIAQRLAAATDGDRVPCVHLRRRLRFRAKGTPSDLKVLSAQLEP